MRVRAGTSGYSYKPWKGSFYPEALPDREMLRYYAERLPAVEINNTFYRLPKRSVLEAWAEQVPEDFRFVLKASRRITHFKRLREAEEETGYLLRTAAALGSRLGAILFQLPPKLPADLPRLERFLDGLRAGLPAAFEFRHASWHDEAVFDCLRARGCALCIADSDAEPAAELVATAPWGYLRLRRSAYSDADLAAWAERLRAQDWEQAYVFFKHEEAGAGPRLATRLLELVERASPRQVRPVRRARRVTEAGRS